jgi:hypothetical protein
MAPHSRGARGVRRGRRRARPRRGPAQRREPALARGAPAPVSAATASGARLSPWAPVAAPLRAVYRPDVRVVHGLPIGRGGAA